MKIMITFLVVVMSFPAVAAPTCGSNKSTTLFAPGKSLANSSISDQDGMATCGSNALSHVIKSSLKTTKDLSYMDIAFQAAQRNWGTQENPTKQFMVSKDRMAFEGMDDMCASLESIKKNGGICPRENFSFENTVYSKWGGNDGGSKQMELMLTISKFLDVQNTSHNFKTPQMKQQELKKIIKYVEDKKLSYADKCKANGDGKNDVDFQETFQSLMGNLMLWISTNKTVPAKKACIDASVKYFNRFVKTPLSSGDSHPLDIRPEMLQKFKKSFNFASLFSQYKKGINPPGHEFSAPLARFIDQNSNELNLMKLCQLTDETSDHPLSGKKLYQPSLTVSVNKELKASLNSSECEKAQLASWLKSSKASKEVEALCPGFQGARELMGAVSVLPLWDESLSTILPRMLPEGKAGLNNLTQILAPNCAPNRVDVSKLKCETYNAYVRINRKPLETIRTDFRNVSQEQLDKGNAVAVGICEHFLRGDSSLTSDSCEAANGGYHMIAVTGYRCVNGLMEYEVANSWGNNCPVKQGTKDKAIECVMDNKGWPSGRFWVKEDNLLNNVQTFYKISR